LPVRGSKAEKWKEIDALEKAETFHCTDSNEQLRGGMVNNILLLNSYHKPEYPFMTTAN